MIGLTPGLDSEGYGEPNQGQLLVRQINHPLEGS